MATVAPIIDARIARMLDDGDVEGAALLAAKIASPIAHLKVMEAINEYVRKPKPKGRTMLELSEQAATITKFDTDKRASDDPTKPAPAIAEVTFLVNMTSDVLAHFSPTLRSLLFCKNGAVQHDIASQAHDAPDVRHPKILAPYKWREDMEGAEVTIHKGLGGKSDLVLPEASIGTFAIEPHDGGMVSITFEVRSKPENPIAFGRLAEMLKTDVSISLAPPKPPAADGTE